MHRASRLALPFVLSVGASALAPGCAAEDPHVDVRGVMRPPVASMGQAEPLAATPQPEAPEACGPRFEVIGRGENRCGIGLGEDDRIRLDGRPIGEPIVGWGRPTRLFLSPASAGGRYRIIDACGEMCGKAFVLDLQDNALRDTFAGRYGPIKDSIFWSPDGAYAILAYANEGFVWVYVVRASDGASWEVLNEGLLVQPESVRWLDTGTFEVRALSCRDRLQACATAVERGATGDLVRVTLTARGPRIDYL